MTSETERSTYNSYEMKPGDCLRGYGRKVMLRQGRRMRRPGAEFDLRRPLRPWEVEAEVGASPATFHLLRVNQTHKMAASWQRAQTQCTNMAAAAAVVVICGACCMPQKAK